MDSIYELPRVIHDAVNNQISTIAETRSWTALLPVLPLGIVFGAIHALTPGHSKIVLASYLVGSRLAAGRGAIVAGARGRAEPVRPQSSFVPNISTPARGTLLVSMGRVRLLVAQQTNVPLAEATQCRRLNA